MHIYGMIQFYVTFSPNKAAYFFFKHPLKIIQKLVLSQFFLHIPIDLYVEASEKIKFHVFGVMQGVHRTPKIGCFFQIYEIQHFCRFITQLVKKLQQWSIYEVIEDILPFVLNTKRPLSDIWLLRYKQNSLGCFEKNSEFPFFQKTPKTVLFITDQPNIAQRPFCI